MYKLHLGNNKEVLKDFAENSIDSIVTDPPYELGFMGKSWDSTGIAYDVKLWKDCLRVLKPGGYILAFSGTRTYHRMAVAIEDAGFEVRDMIEWVYGSGFPKSLDIAKQIDKRGGKSVSWFGKWLREWREKENIPQREVSKLFPSKTGGLTGCVANWELGLNMPTNGQFNLICKTFNLPFESLEEAEREVVGKGSDYGHQEEKDIDQSFGFKADYNLTKGTSEYEGWGTALKPAHEPICMARKPLAEKTVAENCLKWGTGGINIDVSRVEGQWNGNTRTNSPDTKQVYGDYAKITTEQHPQGRFPANLIHDNSEEVRECFPESKSTQNKASDNRQNEGNSMFIDGVRNPENSYTDSGNASRFFKSIIYQAKASKSERNKGCEAVFNLFEQSEGLEDSLGGSLEGGNDKRNGDKPQLKLTKNNHPTVKPIALMEYLIKMVTPKGGIVLDPFNGSGSTGCAAVKNGFDYHGIDITKEYITISEKRIKAY